MRYLELRLHKNAENIYLQDVDKNSVDMRDNYDVSMKEPTVLPAKTCMILVNGVSGIAAGGWASEIPAHDIKDVANMIKTIIKNPNIKLEEVAKNLIPSFPSGGVLCNQDDIIKGYITGRHNVRCRVNMRYDEKKHALVIYGIQPGKRINNLMENIRSKARTTSDNSNPILSEIKEINDLSSNKTGIALTLYLKRDANPELVENKLYKYTDCETTVKIILSALYGDELRLYNIKQFFEEWIQFRKDTIQRITIYDIKSKQKKIHILDGQIIILNDIDNAIKLIKKSSDKEDAKINLMKKYDLTELQAESVVIIPLYKLASLELQKIIDTKESLEQDVKNLFKFLNDDNAIKNRIIEEQDEIIKTTKTCPKTTKLINISRDNNQEDIIEDKDFMITLSKNLYIKRIETDALKTRKRGASGRSNGRVRSGDFIERTFVANSKDHLLLFTNKGIMYDIKIWQIPQCELNNVGTPLKSLINKLNLNDTESEINIQAVLCISNEEYESNDNYLCFATKNGLVKLTSTSEYKTNRSSLLALKIKENDELLAVKYIYNGYQQDIFLATSNGNAIRFDYEEITPSLRPSYGMTGIKLKDDDKVISFDIIQDDESDFITTIATNGLGKNVKIKNIAKIKIKNPETGKDEVVLRNTGFDNQRRGGYGKIISKLRNDCKLVRAVISHSENDQIIITSNEKLVAISVDTIPFTLRPTYGSRIMKLNDKEEIIDLTLTTVSEKE